MKIAKMKEFTLSFFSNIEFPVWIMFLGLVLCVALVFPIVILMIYNTIVTILDVGDDWANGYDTFSG